MRLGKPTCGENLDNVYPARVSRSIFIGSILRYELVVGEGQRISVQLPNDGAHIWQEGEEVQIGWTREDCVLLSS